MREDFQAPLRPYWHQTRLGDGVLKEGVPFLSLQKQEILWGGSVLCSSRQCTHHKQYGDGCVWYGRTWRVFSDSQGLCSYKRKNINGFAFSSAHEYVSGCH